MAMKQDFEAEACRQWLGAGRHDRGLGFVLIETDGGEASIVNIVGASPQIITEIQAGDPDGKFGLVLPACQRCVALCEITDGGDHFALVLAEIDGQPAVEVIDT